ncbi:SRPBCC family protein [Aquibaculum arenosum]|uniref:SRPBCC domain-containing protein n=1 Tax=Aquibaculum arenosum TaxID=3032591 RepID=A0ABT5YPB2_9PROT|nr:SRPBCC domain-containing protein [Fodinicurvata sp. CAU 1616]MDF2096808.1 SRPBCC domain-containing protein [Fodinicurvata sp. CAU 1616]
MEMSGEQRIPAPRQVVWDALNDPEVLKASIPGCESLEQNEAGDAFDAKVRAKVGPVSARFAGSVILTDINPPESYTISGEGKGGAAGFAKGGANVKLTEEGAETLLSYDVNAKVGGKLAQLGSRLIDGTARKMADDFFARFSEIAAERAGGPAPSGTAAAAQPAEPEPTASAELPKAEPAAEPTESAVGAATPQPQAAQPTESAELPKAESAAEPTESAVGAAAPEPQPEPAQPTPEPQPVGAAETAPGAKKEPTTPAAGLPPAAWIGVLVAIIAILLFLIL